MFRYNDKIWLLVAVVVTIVFMSEPAMAAFESLTKAGKDIFTGLRDIIYPASAIGIITVCIGGFFGNINWKWLTAIVVGLVVISCCVAFVDMFAPEATESIPEDVMKGR